MTGCRKQPRGTGPDLVWVEPELETEVEYNEVTELGVLRMCPTTRRSAGPQIAAGFQPEKDTGSPI
jgi:hypothetical protein